jgi:hypothetical protein
MSIVNQRFENIERDTNYNFSNDYLINTINRNMIVYRKDYDEFKNLSLSPIYVENIFTYDLINYLNNQYANCDCGLYPYEQKHFVCECVYLNMDNIPINCNNCYNETNPNKKQHHISQCPRRITEVERACLLLNYNNYRQ